MKKLQSENKIRFFVSTVKLPNCTDNDDMLVNMPLTATGVVFAEVTCIVTACHGFFFNLSTTTKLVSILLDIYSSFMTVGPILLEICATQVSHWAMVIFTKSIVTDRHTNGCTVKQKTQVCIFICWLIFLSSFMTVGEILLEICATQTSHWAMVIFT